METEWELKKEEVPAQVMEAVNEKYGDMEIEEQNKLENESGVFYEFEIEGDGGNFVVLFDEQGNFVSEEHEDDDQ